MAKVKLDTVMTTIEGNALPQEQSFSVGTLIVNALLSADCTSLSVDQKLERYNLAKKVQQGMTSPEKEVNITLEEGVLIKEVCGQVLTPLFIGQIVDALNG